MKTSFVALAGALLWCLCLLPAAFAQDVNGIWTKTTNPDPSNVTIFYQEKAHVRAIGYSVVQGRKAVWYGEGEMKGETLECIYDHSSNATPMGWERAGTMQLTVSADGNLMTGTARTVSGSWSGAIEFRRIQFVTPGAG
jgi:hypothetical protein